MRLAHRLAVLTAAATCVLIVFGGLVTNTGAALAVPDWPTTFGHNMFLFPWSQMVGGVFYEHSHRLLGALVGALTLALAVALWRRGGRLRALGVVAVVAVIAQGVVGGLRVVLQTDTLAMVHGPLAHAFFALVVALALLTSAWMARPAPVVDGATRALTLTAVLLVYAQIVFGALLTHAGRIDLHLAGAVAVFVLVPMVTARLRGTGDAVAGPAARALLVLLGRAAAPRRRRVPGPLLAGVGARRAAHDAGAAGRPPPGRGADPGRRRRAGRTRAGRPRPVPAAMAAPRALGVAR